MLFLRRIHDNGKQYHYTRHLSWMVITELLAMYHPTTIMYVDNVWRFMYIPFGTWRLLTQNCMVTKSINTIQCGVVITRSIFSQRFTKDFMDSASDWYSSPVPAIVYAKTYYIGPRFITALDCTSDSTYRHKQTIHLFVSNKDRHCSHNTIIWSSMHFHREGGYNFIFIRTGIF